MGIKTDAQVYGTEQKLRNKLMHVWPIHIKGAKNTQLRKNSLIKKWYWENYRHAKVLGGRYIE